MCTNKDIPVHGFKNSAVVNIERISHDNPYDFQRVHRHKYFEVLFFVKGGGVQLIDFKTIEIKDYACYMVKPRQIHLLKRDKEADGYLIQFDDASISRELKNSLSILQYYSSTSIIFENDEHLTIKIIQFIKIFADLKKSGTAFIRERTSHILALIIYELELNLIDEYGKNKVVDKNLLKYTKLVDEYFNQYSVKEYASMLHISTRKLTDLVKEAYGVTPLKFVHNALILEIQRELMFNSLNIKEICYKFNFDSLSNFSLFVKKMSGYSPSELQKSLLK